GHIHRVDLTTPSNPTPTPYILKHIQPPPAPSSSSASHRTISESHLRKLISYRAERYFCTNLSRLLHSSGSTKVASLYDVAEEHVDDALLLEDLTVDFPLRAPYTLPLSKTHTAIRWLAGFHATFWNHTGVLLIPPPNDVPDPNTAEGVWAQGGYWHLATRNEEYASLEETQEEYAWLIPYTLPIAEKLRTEALGRTLLHGDVKGANILFSKAASRGDAPKEEKCALYDFQYVGSGLGVVDLVHFLGTTADGRDLGGSENEEGLMRVYFGEVERRCGMGGYTWEVLVQQWEWAVADWMRFMAGCWGNSGWVERRAREVCSGWDREGGL
ncbi:hypothetical protein C7212DRAFT_196911, partial [Tuber magnatum]